MAPLFEFRSGNSPAHRLDPRCKLLLLCLMGAGLVNAGWIPGLLLLSAILFSLGTMGIRIPDLIRQLRYFILFLVMIIGVRGMTAPGPELLSLAGASVSATGLAEGCLVAFRFFTVMVLGLVFTATTRPSELKAAVQWVLKPVPFIPEHRAGVLVGLSLRCLPMILSQANESRQAIQARCGNLRKNPVSRISILAAAMLNRSFRSADRLAMAMEARCYTDERTDPEFRPCGREPLALVLGAGAFLFMLFF